MSIPFQSAALPFPPAFNLSRCAILRHSVSKGQRCVTLKNSARSSNACRCAFNGWDHHEGRHLKPTFFQPPASHLQSPGPQPPVPLSDRQPIVPRDDQRFGPYLSILQPLPNETLPGLIKGYRSRKRLAFISLRNLSPKKYFFCAYQIHRGRDPSDNLPANSFKSSTSGS